MKMNKVFFAFASGSISKENTRKLYIGIAPVFVVAVNPNKAMLEKFFGTELDEEPEYVGEGKIGKDEDERVVPQVRLDFLVATNPAKSNGIEMKSRISFFLKKEFRYNKDKNKVQVIDKYGQTAWASIEEAKTKAIPQYESGPANIDADYRPAYIGEEDLVGFIKQYLNIPNPSYTYTDKNSGEKVTKSLKNPDEALARLDGIDGYFKGNYKELESILKLQPDNVVKVMFGVRRTDDNKEYQAVYTQKFLKNSITDYSRLDKDLQDRKNAGAYPSTEFSIEPLHEYNTDPTDFSQPAAPAVDPLAGNNDAAPQSPWFWGK